ncbi:MAG: 16S rRNA (guanine(966)-N(2))-methyltransferase RsmD [Thermoanaerobacteraceae bacterium]|nr:16S rRNA (guanine(966)-N(2))-methyltransferase RsmD [Thermoanaerobacteraceae bacterium]
MVRIISGTARGRRLKVPLGRSTRPTSERLREALFNILQVEGKSFLDVFAGSGAVGIEALSRGALRAAFIEKDPLALKALRDNLRLTGFDNRAQVLPLDVLQAADRLVKKRERFDFIFLDPPYGQGLGERVLPLFIPLLAEGGWMVLEIGRKEVVPSVRGIALRESRRYGDSLLNLYQKEHGGS